MNHTPAASAIGQKRRRIARLSFGRRASLEMARGRYESCQQHAAMIAWGLRMQTAPGKRAEVQRNSPRPARADPSPAEAAWPATSTRTRKIPTCWRWCRSGPAPTTWSAYLRSEDRRKLVAVMELASRRPEIWVDTIVMPEGLERLATLMGSNAKGEGHE